MAREDQEQAHAKGGKMNDPKHPLWKLARLVVVALILIGCLAFVYAGLDKRDIITVISVLVGLGGFDWLKSSVAKGGDE